MGLEVAAYGALSALWWVSSFSVLLPFVLLLKFSKTFRDRWFSFIFVRVLGPLCNPRMLPLRKRAFQILKEHMREPSGHPLEILEIGVGSGANLQFYPVNARLTALDMNESFESYFRENQKKYPQVIYKRTIVGFAEHMDGLVEDNSMDVVICTYVLCSVKNIDEVLGQVKRVLKPGGKFVFLEHVVFPSSEWSSTVQRFVSPLWQLYCDGCYPDRDIASHIRAAMFSDVSIENQYPSSLMLFIRPMIMGVATK